MYTIQTYRKFNTELTKWRRGPAAERRRYGRKTAKNGLHLQTCVGTKLKRDRDELMIPH